MASPEGFNFERMVQSFESISYKYAGNDALPNAEGFLNSMHSMSMLFDHLGTGFYFVRKDIVDKTKLLRDYYEENSERAESLQDLVEYEIANKTHRIGKPSKFARVKHRPSASRTLWRLLWAVKFLFILLQELAKEELNASSDSFTGTRPMRVAVEKAYNEALFEHHSLALRKAVQAALAFLPSKDSFLAAVGVDDAKHDEYMDRIEGALEPLMTKGYSFYCNRKMTDLP